jgi:hypothetical protein
MPNIPLLEQVMAFIKDHPEKHDQGTWINDCGTAACFAGWTVLLTGWQQSSVDTDEVWKDGSRRFVGSVAREELDLTDADADLMFAGQNTVETLELMGKDLVNEGRLFPRWRFGWDGPERRTDEELEKYLNPPVVEI